MGVSPLATAAGQVTASTLAHAAARARRRPPLDAAAGPSAATVAAVLGLALVSTALAYILYFRLLAAAGATNLLLVTFLIPVSAILLGAAFLGERLEPRHLAGMALIGLGLAAIDGRPIALAAPPQRRLGRDRPVRREAAEHHVGRAGVVARGHEPAGPEIASHARRRSS